MIKWFRKKDWRLVAIVSHGIPHLIAMEGYEPFESKAHFHFYESGCGKRKVKIASGNTGAFEPKQSKFWTWCKDWKAGRAQSNKFPTHQDILMGADPIYIDTLKGQ